MNIRDLEPQTMNFWATAERVYRERDLLSRIDRLLASPFKLSLGGDRIQLLQVIFLQHLDLKAQAEEWWKLEPNLLYDCLAHLTMIGFRHSYSEDLELVRQAEETLGLIAEIDELLRPFAALDQECAQLCDIKGARESRSDRGKNHFQPETRWERD
jgi:hypothetical protein